MRRRDGGEEGLEPGEPVRASEVVGDRERRKAAPLEEVHPPACDQRRRAAERGRDLPAARIHTKHTRFVVDRDANAAVEDTRRETDPDEREQCEGALGRPLGTARRCRSRAA